MINVESVKRIVTAVFLVIATVATTLLLESIQFAVVLGLVVIIAAWEWCHLNRTTFSVDRNMGFILLMGAVVPLLLIYPPVLPWILVVGILWWTSIAILIVFSGMKSQVPVWQAKKWHAVLIIIPAAVAITGLHATSAAGRWYVLACLLIVWTTDTCAYMVGRLWGKTLLAPRISPGKTVEGAIGGLIGASIIGLILYEALPTQMIFSRLDWLLLTVVTAGFSVIGDLAESIYKRSAGVKDSGWILPGHGGILDRIDSTFASAPVFVAGILFVAR